MNRDVSADILIPEEKVAVFIGRAGSNLKEVEQRTNTKIAFTTESNIILYLWNYVLLLFATRIWMKL